jgi:replicative DNA helicase
MSMATSAQKSAPAATGAPRPASACSSAYLPQKTGTGRKTNKNQTAKSQYLYDEDLEKAVLGGILLKPELLPEIIQIISPQDFAYPANTLIFQALTELQEKETAIDMLSLSTYIQEKGKINKLPGQNLYICDLVEHIAAPSTAILYAKKVKELSVKRKITFATQSIQAGLNTQQDIFRIIENAKSELEQIQRESNFDSNIDEYIVNCNPNKENLDFFLRLKEDNESGVLEGSSILLAAKGGTGKTTFCSLLIKELINLGH